MEKNKKNLVRGGHGWVHGFSRITTDEDPRVNHGGHRGHGVADRNLGM